MPRKYAKRKPKYGRRSRRTNRNYRAMRSVSYVPSGLPKQRITKLRYCESIQRTTTSGVLDRYVYRANGAYDPNQSGTGHQPFGFDQWASLFNHYTVLGAKITVRTVAITNASAVPLHTGLYLGDGTSTPYTLYTQFQEAKKGSFRIMLGSIGEKSYRNTSTFSAKKYFGVKDVMDNQNLRATVLTVPAEEAYFHIWVQAADLAATATVRHDVTIDYIIKFTEPKDIASS